jgi:uncharacterized protein (DUF362 family)
MSDNGGRTRREILADAMKAAAAASIGGLVGCSDPGLFPGVGGKWSTCTMPDGGLVDAGAPPAVTPAVIEVNRPESVVGVTIQPDIVATMLEAGLMALASQVQAFNSGDTAPSGGGAADAGQNDQHGVIDNPWKVLLPNYQAGQTIGLKVNCLGPTPTSPAVVRAVIASLRDNLGVNPTNNIIVWDRFRSDITTFGKYSSDDLAGATIRGNLTRGLKTGESEASFVDGGYGDSPCQAPKSSKGNYPRLARLLTESTNLTINLPVFKRHPDSGFTGAMKNIYGMFDIPGEYHDPTIRTALPEIYALPAIRNSISLTIFDALLTVTNGANYNSPDSALGRILLAQDPVAMDSYGWDLLVQYRASKPNWKVDDPTIPYAWLNHAQEIGLGTRSYNLVQV